MKSSEEHAQNGRGMERATRRICEFLLRLVARIRALCAYALSLLLFVGLFAGAALSQDAPKHPDFSGRWRMVKDQSQFGSFTAPDLVVRVVDHHDPTINVHTVQTKGTKTTTADVSYFTDGTETTNVMSGRNATSKAFWDGTALMIRTNTRDSKNQEVEILDRWELSSDGRILTNTSHINSAQGEADLKLVCEKEATGR